jgi:hypothetical protein
MATRRRRARGLGKDFTDKRAPRGCKCPDGAKLVRIGKFGIRCMKLQKFRGRERFLFTKVQPKACKG